MAPDKIRTFRQFWPYYVSQHRDDTCRALHIWGLILAGGFALAAIVIEPIWVLLTPVVAYGMSWIGHLLFERNQPATWHSVKFALWSIRGDMRLLVYTVTGRIGRELRRAEQVYPNAESNAATPNQETLPTA